MIISCFFLKVENKVSLQKLLNSNLLKTIEYTNLVKSKFKYQRKNRFSQCSILGFVSSIIR